MHQRERPKDITHFVPTGIVLNGLGQENPTENRFKYQDKESLALFGLNGIADFGARYLDKTIGGRFWSVDPLADVVPSMTPYRYAFNNPVNVTDPTGMLEDDDKKTEIFTDGYGTYKGFTKNIRSDGDYNATGNGDDKQSPSNFQKPSQSSIIIGGNVYKRQEDGTYQAQINGITPDYTIESTYIGGKVLGPIIGRLVRFLGFGSRSVWAAKPFQRGRDIESILGSNLPSNFPTIDKFANGVATSIKSVDLKSVTYQNTNTLQRLLQGYVDKVATFNGRNWAGVNINQSSISGRALEVAIPKGNLTAAQQQVINQVIQYGANSPNPVTVKFIPIP